MIGNIPIFGPITVTPTPVTTNSAVTAKNIYICDPGSSAVDVYTADQSGTVTPTSYLNVPSGSPPEAVTGDAAGNLYAGVENNMGNYVKVYASGSTTASRTIQLNDAANASADQILAMTTDATGNLYVGTSGDVIYVYGPTASGTATPLRTIAGSMTSIAGGYLTGITQMTTDAAGDLYVADGGGGSGSKVVMFPSGSSGNVAPVVVTAATYLPVGVALDTAGNIYITQGSGLNGTVPAAIVEFAAGSVAGAVPMRTIAGSNTGFTAYLHSLQVDKAGNIFVLEYVSQFVVFGATATGNVAPASTLLRTLGASTDSQFYLQ